MEMVENDKLNKSLCLCVCFLVEEVESKQLAMINCPALTLVTYQIHNTTDYTKKHLKARYTVVCTGQLIAPLKVWRGMLHHSERHGSI